jgi:hypothetical protein
MLECPFDCPHQIHHSASCFVPTNPDISSFLIRRFNVTKGYGFITPDAGKNKPLLSDHHNLVPSKVDLTQS